MPKNIQITLLKPTKTCSLSLQVRKLRRWEAIGGSVTEIPWLQYLRNGYKVLVLSLPFPSLDANLCSAVLGISIPTVHTNTRDPTGLPSISCAPSAPLPEIHTEVHPELNQIQEQL